MSTPLSSSSSSSSSSSITTAMDSTVRHCLGKRFRWGTPETLSPYVRSCFFVHPDLAEAGLVCRYCVQHILPRRPAAEGDVRQASQEDFDRCVSMGVGIVCAVSTKRKYTSVRSQGFAVTLRAHPPIDFHQQHFYQRHFYGASNHTLSVPLLLGPMATDSSSESHESVPAFLAPTQTSFEIHIRADRTSPEYDSSSYFRIVELVYDNAIVACDTQANFGPLYGNLAIVPERLSKDRPSVNGLLSFVRDPSGALSLFKSIDRTARVGIRLRHLKGPLLSPFFDEHLTINFDIKCAQSRLECETDNERMELFRTGFDYYMRLVSETFAAQPSTTFIDRRVNEPTTPLPNEIKALSRGLVHLFEFGRKLNSMISETTMLLGPFTASDFDTPLSTHTHKYIERYDPRNQRSPDEVSLPADINPEQSGTKVSDGEASDIDQQMVALVDTLQIREW